MKFFITMSLLLLALETAPISAQDSLSIDSTGTERLHRDPRTAQVLGIVLPGWGHLYAGEYVRWYFTQVGVVGGLAMGAILLESEGCAFAPFAASSCSDGRRRSHKIVGAAMLGMAAWAWISSARDAPRAAERANDRHSRKRKRVSIVVEPGLVGPAEVNAGVTVRW
jgi:hypothetical protein